VAVVEDKAFDSVVIPSRQLIPFLCIVFGLAWGLLALFILATDWVVSTFGELSGSHPLFILAVHAPAIAALILVARSTGLPGLGRFLSRLLVWRTSPMWLLFLVLGFPVLFFAGAFIKGNASSAPMLTETATVLLPAIAFMLILGPVEEIGWRGFALPILQRHLVPFWSGLLLGIVWALWHLPAFMLGGTPQAAWGFLPFFAGSVACSVILTAFFNDARGSILLAMLFHFQMNNPLWPDAQPYDMMLFVLASAVIVWFKRVDLFSSSGAIRNVIPAPAA